MFLIDGTLIAPSDYTVIGTMGSWIMFHAVEDVTISGGTLDGQGTGLWFCKSKSNSTESCPEGATNLEFSNSKNIQINGLASVNSQMFHIVINRGRCISIGPGTKNLWIEKISCGPGHGISIGSLGKELDEEGVHNVTVKNVTFTGTENGVRIKSWSRPSTGFAKDILFQHAIMNKVYNPIIIDQNYCPNEKNCPVRLPG
ncbi:unnamed protein product [Linum perenne]